MESMKVHQFARGLLWEHEVPSSLTLGVCKRFAPMQVPNPDSLFLTSPTSNTNNLISSRSSTTTHPAAFDLKSFIRPDSRAIKLASSHDINRDTAQVETHPGGTRWNPTQEQIGILEMFYTGGMRTPNAQQIEQITAQLAKYGKIEGKNVFYWFQNHKARERQKQKRSKLGLTHSPRTPTATTNSTLVTLNDPKEILVGRDQEESPYKRKCWSWSFESLEDDKSNSCNNEQGNKTLELFPLHPEGILSRSA